MTSSNTNDASENKSNKPINPLSKVHTKSRTTPYPSSTVARASLNDNQVKWTVELKQYNPPFFTHPSVLKHHIPDASFKNYQSKKASSKWNKIDNKIDRRSHHGNYKLDAKTLLPLNPNGRTGLAGRGLLWRWGPNHAADPIVTRWLRDKANQIRVDTNTGKKILQFVAIERVDGGGWAIPGGMIDPGETVSAALKREFGEESLDSFNATKQEKLAIQKQVEKVFAGGDEVYKGYVDDPRNTDNAWMETVAVHFHDADGTSVGKFQLHAGDDAGKVKWMDINSKLKLYASHHWFIQNVAQRMDAHW